MQHILGTILKSTDSGKIGYKKGLLIQYRLIDFIVHILKQVEKQAVYFEDDYYVGMLKFKNKGVLKNAYRVEDRIYQTDVIYQAITKKIHADIDHKSRIVYIPLTKTIEVYIGPWGTDHYKASIITREGTTEKYTLLNEYYKNKLANAFPKSI